MDVGVEAAVEGVTGEGGDVADDYELHACTIRKVFFKGKSYINRDFCLPL